MFDYAYGNFSKVYLKDQNMPEEISSYTEEAPYVLLPSGVEFSSLEKDIVIEDEADASGTVTFYYEGQNVGSTEVVLTEAYIDEVQAAGNSADGAASGTAEGNGSDEAGFSSGNLLIRVLICAGAAVLLLIIVFLIVARYRYLKKKRMRAARRRRQNAARAQRQQMSGSTGSGRPRPGAGGHPGPYPGVEQRRVRMQEEPRRRDRNGRYR